jgi:hypothetical protein
MGFFDNEMETRRCVGCSRTFRSQLGGMMCAACLELDDEERKELGFAPKKRFPWFLLLTAFLLMMQCVARWDHWAVDQGLKSGTRSASVSRTQAP